MDKLRVEQLGFAYPGHEVLHDISLHVSSGEFVSLLGPNGCGKSTLLKNIYGVLKPHCGAAFVDGEALLQMPHRERAQRMAVIAQEQNVPFAFTVREIVAMGRIPHKRLLETNSASDKQIVQETLSLCGLSAVAERSYEQLSGGEKQRVVIARALVQQVDLMILDEPTNHLDIGFQLQTLELVSHLQGTVFAALHDLNLAAMYSDRIYLLSAQGEIYAAGTAEEVLTVDNIRAVYGVCSEVIRHQGQLHICYLREDIRKGGNL